MTWREELGRVTVNGRRMIGASFRGVTFLVESEERSGGRRAVVHEFPLRDDPFVEDLGRRARGFRLDGYVIGDDYLTQRDKLLDALEGSAGPGELVLPGYGAKRAICDKFTVRTTRGEGGLAMFAFDFAEAPTQAPVPTVVVDAPQQVATSADAAIDATDAELVDQYHPAGLPAFALASAETVLANLTAGMGVALGPVASTTQELAALTGRVALITAQASSLVRAPADIIGAFRPAITGLVETALAAPGAVMGALIEAYGADYGTPVDPITATREIELANQVALAGALRRVIAIEAARIAPLVPYASIEEATAARDQIAAMLRDQAATAADTAYPALVNLRSELLRAVPGGTAFARVVTVTRRVAIPSLLLAYQLYGSVELELDLVARNRGRIRNPGFVAGELQVLSDG